MYSLWTPPPSRRYASLSETRPGSVQMFIGHRCEENRNYCLLLSIATNELPRTYN